MIQYRVSGTAVTFTVERVLSANLVSSVLNASLPARAVDALRVTTTANALMDYRVTEPAPAIKTLLLGIGLVPPAPCAAQGSMDRAVTFLATAVATASVSSTTLQLPSRALAFHHGLAHSVRNVASGTTVRRVLPALD